MNGREQGFLLLTSFLGDLSRHPLTVAQFRNLAQRAASMTPPKEERDLTEADLIAIGCGRDLAHRILGLLEQQELLESYLRRGQMRDCRPITRVSPAYPVRLRKGLGLDSPGCLWSKGDSRLLDTPTVALVGSRELRPENADFAAEAGRQAAMQGFTLVSGNARGADRIAQDSCLDSGGRVISVVADALEKYPLRRNVLYLSEEGFDRPFSSQRALSRNRVIHCLGEKTLVAQCSLRTGGTWSGTRQNLKNRWSPVFCFDDGSPATYDLLQMGATPIGFSGLADLAGLQKTHISFFDQ